MDDVTSVASHLRKTGCHIEGRPLQLTDHTHPLDDTLSLYHDNEFFLQKLIFLFPGQFHGLPHVYLTLQLFELNRLTESVRIQTYGNSLLCTASHYYCGDNF